MPKVLVDLIKHSKPNDSGVWLVSVEEALNTWVCGDSGTSRPDRRAWLKELSQPGRQTRIRILMGTIEDRGFVAPMECYPTLNGNTYRYCNGHHRFAAAYQLGYEFIPVHNIEKRHNLGTMPDFWDTRLEEWNGPTLYREDLDSATARKLKCEA